MALLQVIVIEVDLILSVSSVSGILLFMLYPVQDFGSELEGIVVTFSSSKVIFISSNPIISLLIFTAIGRIHFWETLFLTSLLASPFRTVSEELMVCVVLPESFCTKKESPVASPKGVTDTFLAHCIAADLALVDISRNFFCSLGSILVALDFSWVICSEAVK